MRTPPHSLESEKTVIGGVLLHPDCRVNALALVEAADFYHPAHAAIWEAVVELDRGSVPIDAVTVLDRMRSLGTAERLRAFGDGYFTELAAEVVSVENIAYHATAVRQKADRRRVISRLSELAATGFGDDGDRDYLARVDEAVLELATSRRGSSAGIPIRQAIRSWLVEVEQRYKRYRDGGTEVVGVPTGIAGYDTLTGGLRPGEVTVLAARPKIGKTALALNIVEHAASKGIPVYVVSQEMPNSSLLDRLVSAYGGGVNGLLLRNGHLGAREWIAIQKAAAHLVDLPLVLDDEPMNIRELAARVIRWRASKGVCSAPLALLVVDYIQLLRSTGDEQTREREVASASGGLKALSKQARVAVLALAQLNRDVEKRSDKHPMLSDLRESGAIEQDADAVSFLYRDEVYDGAANNPHKGTAEWMLAAQRSGPVGTVWLDWSEEHTKFTYREQPPPDKESNRSHYPRAVGRGDYNPDR